MARLSGYLTGQLANPSYAGMLSSNVQGGMQGISDALAARRQINANDSMLAMLTGADPTDPNVVSSVQAVARQMGQDPIQAQAMIQNAQDQQMRKEDQKRQAEAFVWQKANAKWQDKLRKDAVEEENVLKAALGVYQKTGSASEVMKMVPVQHQAAVQEAIDGKVRSQQMNMEFQEYLKEGRPIPEEELKGYEGMSEAAKQAVQVYREQAKTVPRQAAQNLRSVIERDLQSRLYRTEGQASQPKVPTSEDIKLARDQIVTLAEDQNGDSWTNPFSWGKGEVDEVTLELAAHDLAGRLKNGAALSKELVTEVVETAKNGTPPPGDDTPPEEYRVKPSQRSLDLLDSDPSPEALREFEEEFGAIPRKYRK